MDLIESARYMRTYTQTAYRQTASVNATQAGDLEAGYDANHVSVAGAVVRVAVSTNMCYQTTFVSESRESSLRLWHGTMLMSFSLIDVVELLSKHGRALRRSHS